MQLVIQKYKDHKRLLWTAICQQIRQPRKNGKIPRNIQPIKTEWGDTENVNRPINSRETKSVIKSLLTKKILGPDGLTGEFY